LTWPANTALAGTAPVLVERGDPGVAGFFDLVAGPTVAAAGPPLPIALA
jgi:hypothetical protein